MRNKHLRAIGVKCPAVKDVVFRQIIRSFYEVLFTVKLKTVHTGELLRRLPSWRIRLNSRRKLSILNAAAHNIIFFEKITPKRRLDSSGVTVIICYLGSCVAIEVKCGCSTIVGPHKNGAKGVLNRYFFEVTLLINYFLYAFAFAVFLIGKVKCVFPFFVNVRLKALFFVFIFFFVTYKCNR